MKTYQEIFTLWSNESALDLLNMIINIALLKKILKKIIGKSLKPIIKIVISHRLSPLKVTDNILVLDNGMIIDKGTWEELASRNGSFIEMLKKPIH